MFPYNFSNSINQAIFGFVWVIFYKFNLVGFIFLLLIMNYYIYSWGFCNITYSSKKKFEKGTCILVLDEFRIRINCYEKLLGKILREGK